MDNTIIEHLACQEINKCILQPPFHLVSNVQWNDKGLSFDGDISVYTKEIKKTDHIGKVPIQIKGTTSHKKITKKNKIKFSVQKDDLDVYYKNGKGVLYLVVTVNPKTYLRQAYYRILAPLDLKDLLIKLESSGNQSITISLKKLEYEALEEICKTFLNLIEKQPKNYIEASTKKEFAEYKIDYAHLHSDSSFDYFEEPAYIYGVLENVEIPLKIAKLHEIRGLIKESVVLDGEKVFIDYEMRVGEKKINLIIENSLTLEFIKYEINGIVSLKNGKVKLGKIKTLGSYLKCLKLIKFLLDFNKIPLPSFNFDATLNEKGIFQNVVKDIKIHEELIDTFRLIGINDDYIFNEQENLSNLFNGIIKVFKNNQFDLINISTDKKLENGMIYSIRLSEYIWVMLIFDEDKFIDFFSKKALARVGGFIPKNKQTAIIGESNWEQNYWKVSIFATQSISRMNDAANFKYEILKLSFQDAYHDVRGASIDISLDYINYFDESSDDRYLDIAQDLIQRYIVEDPENNIAKINLYQIKLRQHNQLLAEEVENVLDILEKAEKEYERSISFACEVLLQNKLKAKRLFDTLEKSEQNILKNYPIFRLYEI